MTDAWTARWDDRYRQPDYAYGTAPNAFLQQELAKLAVGKLLLPAEGEGRNAVFAARRGWQVAAFDISTEGRAKALRLAAENGVSIDYQIIPDLATAPYAAQQFDAIALIYAHFPAAIKSQLHRALDAFLRPGGVVIFEAFSKHHLEYQARNPSVGGPKDEPSLFSLEEIRADFSNYTFRELEEAEVELREGPFHQGVGSVIRMVGVKG